MSFIHDALKKAQQRKNGSYSSYEKLISGPRQQVREKRLGKYKWVFLPVALLVLTMVPAPRAAEEAPAHGGAPASPGAAAGVAVTAHWAYSKFMWAAVALVFSVMGTSWAQSKIGMAGAGAMAEKPELAGTIIILIAIPETMVILGFVISAMIIFA